MAATIAEPIEMEMMRFITQYGGKTSAALKINGWELDKNTIALLRLLALGRRQIEEGKFKPAREVFAEMDLEALGRASSGD